MRSSRGLGILFLDTGVALGSLLLFLPIWRRGTNVQGLIITILYLSLALVVMFGLTYKHRWYIRQEAAAHIFVCTYHGLINYKDTKAKCRHLKELPENDFAT
jgi:hypothetical protein